MSTVRSKEHVSTVDSLSPKAFGPTQGNNPYNSRNTVAHIQRGWNNYWSMMGVMSQTKLIYVLVHAGFHEDQTQTWGKIGLTIETHVIKDAWVTWSSH